MESNVERRPISARKTTWAQRIATMLAGTGITPNAISVWGMVFGILAGAAFWLTRLETLNWLCWLAGAALVGLRLGANMFDGMVAEIQRSTSPVGSLYNEVPDRISDAVTLIGFGYALGANPTLGWLAALMAVFTAYVRTQAAVSGAAQDFRGPMAKPHRMAAIIAGAIVVSVMSMFSHEPGWVPEALLSIIILGAAATSIRRLRAAAALLTAAPHE